MELLTFEYSGSITNLAASGNAVRVDGTTGGSVTVENPGGRSSEAGAGLAVSNSSGDVTIDNFDITDTSGPGIFVQGNDFTNKGATFDSINISNTTSTQNGITLQTNTGSGATILNNVGVTTVVGTGLLANTNTNITMTGTNSVTSTGATAVNISNGTGNHKLLFSDISSTGSPFSGISLSGITGGTNTFNVTGGITIDSANGPSLSMQNSKITANIPTTTITAGGNGGIQLFDMNDLTTTETLTFNTATIATTGGTGLLISNKSPSANNGLITFGDGLISALTGTAIDATNANLQANFSSVTSSGGAVRGISLVGSGSTGPSGIIIGSTTLTGITGTGILLRDNEPTGNQNGVYANFGNVTLQGTSGTGIAVAGTNALFSGANIDGFPTGVLLTSSTLADTIFEMQGTSITGSATGISITSTNGQIDATIRNSPTITATASALTAITGGDDIFIDATNNTQNANYNLTRNAPDTLGITQTNIATMGTQNNGVTVVDGGTTITGGQTVQTPIP